MRSPATTGFKSCYIRGLTTNNPTNSYHVSFARVTEPTTNDVLAIQTTASGPSGSLPLSDTMLREWASGDLFGLSQNAGMGWRRFRKCSVSAIIDSQHSWRRACSRWLHRSRWVIIRVIGSESLGASRCARIEIVRWCAICCVCSPTRAMVARKAQSACSIACRIRYDAAMLFRRFDSFAAATAWHRGLSRHATKVYPP